MTGFQLTRLRPAVAPRQVPWSEPAQTPAAESPVRTGRHASAGRAKLTLRRLFYVARHATG
ncbi:MAG: hypothetical protein ACJ74U_08665 [Jatrophihabitantaceae bacterium]